MYPISRHLFTQNWKSGSLHPLQHMCGTWGRCTQSTGASTGGTDVEQCSVPSLSWWQLQHDLGVWDAGTGLHHLHGAGLVRNSLAHTDILLQYKMEIVLLLLFNSLGSRVHLWLPLLHEIPVTISRSPQNSWWGLLLAEMCPAHRVTCVASIGLHAFFKKMCLNLLILLVAMGDLYMYFNLLLVCALFTRYINGVKPGEYGVPKPFYFPCLPSYWTGNPRRSVMKEVSRMFKCT